jgi:hypothetical protein
MGKLTQYDYLKGELLLFNKQKQDLTQKVKSFCQNKEYPLDARWNLFINSDFGEHKNYIQHFDTIDLEYLRDFYKYELIESDYLIDIYFDYMSEDLYDNLDITCNYGTDEYQLFIETHVNPKIDIFKEEILQLFIKSFTYDW